MYVVTGSSSGLGREIYRVLKEKENFVIGLDLKDSDFIVDVSNFKSIENFVNQIPKETKEIFGLITSAGVCQGNNIINTNYFGSIDLINALSKKIKIENVVLVGSTLIKLNLIDKILLNYLIENNKDKANEYVLLNKIDDLTTYITSKKALEIYCNEKSKKIDIRINIVNPGLLDTKMTSIFIKNSFFKKIFINKFNKEMPKLINLYDVTNLIYFLLKNKSIYRQSIFIDEGF